MLINDFEILIGSPIELEKLICEIRYKNKIIADITQEAMPFMLEIYPDELEQYWEVPLEDFQKVLIKGKKYLLGEK